MVGRSSGPGQAGCAVELSRLITSVATGAGCSSSWTVP